MSFKVGDIKTVTVQVTDKMVRQFAEMSGDMNPMHLDDEYAKNTRYGRRIAHGMIAGALISRALAMELGHGGIYLSQTLKFLLPVFIDDVLTIQLRVASLREGKGIGNIETTVTKQTGELVVKGEALILKGEFV
ncbi:MAG: protein dehydratase [Bdellovibrio sp. CG10_big_fil_rev_8_21_14_0_10_47_8]|nr:MAG: protein dehydratase [Bdellovibrio sp. CG10_big_fil_rev_8_21_14_0_10_47_8]